MTANPEYLLRRLQPGEMLRIDGAQGSSIVVFRGLLWITQDGDPRDVFIGRGETFTIDRPGRVLVEAIDESRLLLLGAESPDRRAARHAVPGGPALRPVA
jgi:hypothetical protein